MEEQKNEVLETLNSLKEQVSNLEKKLAQHEEIHNNFRTSFRNLENLINLLKERNHLR